jgi:hypothetical protein
MAAPTPKNTIKQWFVTNLFPTQLQFWAWLDAYWHKAEAIPQTAVENLESTLDQKAELQALLAHISDPNAHGLEGVNIKDIDSLIVGGIYKLVPEDIGLTLIYSAASPIVVEVIGVDDMTRGQGFNLYQRGVGIITLSVENTATVHHLAGETTIFTQHTIARIMVTEVNEVLFYKINGGEGGVQLGETSDKAYYGDKGKAAYDHTGTTGNPHGTTKSDIGLSNVDNTSDVNKPVSTAQANAIAAKLNIADVANNLTTALTTAGKALDARQGKVLSDSIANKAVAADYDSTPTDVIKLLTIKSIVDWKNAISFWKSTYFAGTGSRLLQANATGDISASVQILSEDIYVTDNDIITAAAGATFNSGNGFTATITPANSKVLKAGQYCKSATYKYEAMAGDNIVTRIPLG